MQVLLGLMLLCAGCGAPDALQRTIVTGAVTYNDAPVQNGEIRFVPTGQTTGPVSGATIISGRYRADGLGGVPAGTYRVEIQAFQAPENAPVDDGPAAVQYIPDRYNRQSELTLTVDPSRPEQVADFALAP